MEQQTTPKEINTLAVDGDIVAYRCSAVCEEETKDVAMETIDEFLFNMARQTGISNVVIFISPQTNFRYDVAVTKPYKGNRKSIVHPKYREFNSMYLQKSYGAQVIKGYEADDAIASFMTQHEGVAHAGIDKDIRQVEGWHYNFVKRIWQYTDDEDSVLRQYRQACMGDTSDNIPGLPGIGAKKAEKAITDQYTAREQALFLYKQVMVGKSEEQVLEYFEEQFALVTMVDTLKIDFDKCIEIEPPQIFESHDDEGGFIGTEAPEEAEEFNEPKPRLEL